VLTKTSLSLQSRSHTLEELLVASVYEQLPGKMLPHFSSQALYLESASCSPNHQRAREKRNRQSGLLRVQAASSRRSPVSRVHSRRSSSVCSRLFSLEPFTHRRNAAARSQTATAVLFPSFNDYYLIPSHSLIASQRRYSRFCRPLHLPRKG